MKKNVLLKLTFIALAVILSAAACNENLEIFTKKAKFPECYGNGVYYFDCTGKEFAQSLSNFLEDGKKIITITNIHDNGGQDGYLVIVDNKEESIHDNHLVSN